MVFTAFVLLALLVVTPFPIADSTVHCLEDFGRRGPGFAPVH